MPYIATRAEAAVGAVAALEMLAERRGEIDAAIVAAFGDPGLGGARELFDFPVVGMAEAAMLMACMLGRSFAIVSFAKALEPWFAEIVAWHGLSGRCAAIRTLDEGFRSIDDVQNEKEAGAGRSGQQHRQRTTPPTSSSWPARRSPASPTRSGSACPCRWSTASRPPSPWPKGWCA